MMYCIITYTMPKIIKIIPNKFDWNKGNKEKNLIKHKVSYYECEQIFFNKPLHTLRDKKHSQKEKRYIAIGKTRIKRQLFIIFTFRNNKIRIISARDLSRKERKIYDKK